MSEHVTTSRLANSVARAIRGAFDQFQHDFGQITRRAKGRFAGRDWEGMYADSRARLEIYEFTVREIVARVQKLLSDRVRSRIVWVSIKAVYSGLIDERDDWEIAETFYNSITRRIFTTVGVDEEIEFVHTDFRSPPTLAKTAIHRTFAGQPSLEDLLNQVIASFELPLTPAERQLEAHLAAAEIERRLTALGKWGKIEAIDMIKPAFYRGEHAHFVGRMTILGHFVPLVLSFRHPPEGVCLAAVLVEEDDLSLLFSYTRSYFQVDVERPYELVRFVKSIIPRKPTAEIYISIGYNKHGKTELYRHALRHLAGSTDKYQLARGQRGMVMVVFTMPSYPVVFKIIKDQFDYPKSTTRQAVIDCYRLVFQHDRAGRLIDAQEYQYMTLDRDRFDQALLDELLSAASQTVSVEGNHVVIKHCYAERRVIPLNLYLQEADAQAARNAVIDYGQTIKDLALTNIFPGDLMLKNFGLTRQRRVVFYDYDEVCRLTDCTFRKMPETDDYDDQIAAEPWFAVGKHDVFPEEFRYFLGLPAELRSAFMEHHADLLSVDYWLDVQQQLRSGKLFHILPHSQDKQIRRPETLEARRGAREATQTPVSRHMALQPAERFSSGE